MNSTTDVTSIISSDGGGGRSDASGAVSQRASDKPESVPMAIGRWNHAWMRFSDPADPTRD